MAISTFEGNIEIKSQVYALIISLSLQSALTSKKRDDFEGQLSLFDKAEQAASEDNDMSKLENTVDYSGLFGTSIL